MTCPQTSTLGVYLLGALEPEDRSSFESHLHGCEICRAELVRLAPLPGLLNQISLADFEEPGAATLTASETKATSIELADLPPVDPPPLEPVAEPDTPSDARPRRRFWVAAAAAAVVVAITVAAILGYTALQQDPPAAQAVTWSATNPVNGIKAEVKLTPTDWGTDVRVWMSNVPPGKECKLVVMARNGYHDTAGYREVAGWWKTGHEGKPGVPGSTSIDLDMIYKLQFIDDDDIQLVDIHAPQ
jgi:anti-sigma factor RsiW